MTTAANTKIVRCCNCRGMMRVTARALSVFCPHCQTRVSIENLRIVGSHPGKRLATAGDILVEASSRLQLDIVCNRITIHGRVKGSVSASQSVEIGRTGQVIGDINAPKLVVDDGGSIQGHFKRTEEESTVGQEPASAASKAQDASGAELPDAAAQPKAPEEVLTPSRPGVRTQPRPLRPTGL